MKTRIFLLVLIVSIFPLQAKGANIRVYPTSNYNTDGTAPVKHIFANGVEVATINGSGTSATPYYIATDNLTGSNVATDKIGKQIELADYLPFGSIRLDQKTGTFSEQRKFAGQEFDPDTGLNYMNARYYNSKTGKFISQDPTFWQVPVAILSDPQQLNSYSYARDNPLINIDPDGKLTVVVPGTFYQQAGWNAMVYGSSFYDTVRGQLGESPYLFNWSGQDNKAARDVASANLAGFINNHKFVEGEKLNIIAHSHGGNVALQATDLLHHKIDNIVTLGTPVRNDYPINESKVGSVLNVYSSLDPVQVLGGGMLNINPMSKTGEFGPASRIFSSNNVTKLNVTTAEAGATLSKLSASLPFNFFSAVNSLIKNHTSMWQNGSIQNAAINFLRSHK